MTLLNITLEATQEIINLLSSYLISSYRMYGLMAAYNSAQDWLSICQFWLLALSKAYD